MIIGMEFGANGWIWGAGIDTDEFERLVARAASMGFDTFELPIEAVGDVDYERGGDLLAEHGLDASVVVAMTEDRDLLHEDPAVREQGMAYVRECIEATAALGGTNLVGPLYAAVGRTWRQTPADRREAVALLVEELSELAAYAADHGVVLCVEPLNRFETSFLNTVEQTMTVIERVDHDACGVLFDTFHANIEEADFGDAIRRAGSSLEHVHACGNDRGAPGNGHLPWPDIAAALDEVGYDGPLVIETFTPDVESIARAAAIWRPLAASQNQLARDGLSFLQATFS
jgi:D-psicose/D-tagatose/L-ribulose 3-epimerase